MRLTHLGFAVALFATLVMSGTALAKDGKGGGGGHGGGGGGGGHSGGGHHSGGGGGAHISGGSQHSGSGGGAHISSGGQHSGGGGAARIHGGDQQLGGGGAARINGGNHVGGNANARVNSKVNANAPRTGQRSSDFTQRNLNNSNPVNSNRYGNLQGNAQGHTSFYRGNPNVNFDRNSSKFFANNAPFGGNNARFNGQWNHYGGYGGYGQGYGNYYGYGGYGRGYGGYGGFGFLPLLLGYGVGGYGYGAGGYGGYGGYGPAYSGGYGADYVDNGQTIVVAPPTPPTAPADDDVQVGLDFAAQGEANFRAGRYQQAAADFRHALVDDPNNAGIVMLLAQSLFQVGEFVPAAGAIEMGMGVLPEDQWGAVVQNYKQLYGNTQDYTDQLKKLEAARGQNPDDPALRFLLGNHFGYLGYPQQAVRELGKAVQLEPRDPAARRLHDLFAAKIGVPIVGPAAKTEQPQGQGPQASQGEPPAAGALIDTTGARGR